MTMKCDVKGCDIQGKGFVGIKIYSNGVVTDQQIMCQHHFIVNNLATLMALKRVNPKLYAKMEKTAQPYADYFPDDAIMGMFGVSERRS